MDKVKDLLNDSINGNGLFTAMSNPIWANDFDSSELDVYFILHYGEKYASPYLLFFKDANGHISNNDLKTIANAIYSVKRTSWEQLYKGFKSEYNPIHNVDATIEITEDNTHNDNRTTTSSTTDSDSSTTSSNATGGNSSNTNNTTSGYNSSGYVPDNASASSGNTSASSSSNASSTGHSNSSGSDINNGGYNIVKNERRYGNIGVTESTAMLKHHKELWEDWDFIIDNIMKDISDIIALSIY